MQILKLLSEANMIHTQFSNGNNIYYYLKNYLSRNSEFYLSANHLEIMSVDLNNKYNSYMKDNKYLSDIVKKPRDRKSVV